ncbi:MAG TPA: hypothetical protein QF753_08595 [Victivallales bacterium]|nr:hypothetical protein [Victivallales bacterium]
MIAENLVTPAQYLKSIPRPNFKKENTMLPLTRWGWILSLNCRIELADNWGFALEFGPCTNGYLKKLSNPESNTSKIVKLCRSNPEKYSLFILANRKLPKKVPPSTWTRNSKGEFLNAKAKSQDGNEWHPGLSTVYSPEAPDSVWEEAGKLNAEPIENLIKKCPVSIILSGGEYGIGVLGFAKKVWEKDPVIIKAKGNKSWFEYISERKANEEILIANAIKKAAPNRRLYIYYPTDGGFHRNEYPGWNKWYYGYQWMKPVSDLPNGYAYYMQFNTGWTGSRDLLTQALDAKGFEIKYDEPLSYNWLCAGWDQKNLGPEEFSDIPLYTGFLKSYYNVGMLGGVAGYFSYPKGGFKSKFKKNKPPHWLQQIVVLSRVHALFSHYEDFLRNGTLLPGPYRHPWSKHQPAYMFPVLNKKTDKQITSSKFTKLFLSLITPPKNDIKIIIRKHNSKNQWLISAWSGKRKDEPYIILQIKYLTNSFCSLQ